MCGKRRSGVYDGWELHLATTVAATWVPLTTRLTPDNVSGVAPSLIEELPEEARFVLRDSRYNAPRCSRPARASERFLVASGQEPCPPAAAEVKVRRILHRLRHVTIENFNGTKAVFEAHGPVPTKA